MRERDKPRSHVIEPARARLTCQECGQPIEPGELQLSEAFVADEGKWARAHQYARTPRARADYDDGPRHEISVNPDLATRAHHLTCAAKGQPFKLQSALAATSIVVPHRAALEKTIESTLAGADAAEENPDTRDEYEKFVARLRAAPDDDLALVFGDWLQSVGDPRGELVGVQRGIETAEGEAKRKLLDTEKKLLAQHRKRFLPERPVGTSTWHRGFVRRLSLGTHDLEPSALSRVFAHPSYRLLRELVIDVHGALVAAANLPRPLPATLRLLEIGGEQLGHVSPLLADAVPQLERLVLRGAADFDDIRHGALATLELVASDAHLALRAAGKSDPRALVDRIRHLSGKRLPALASVSLRVAHGLDDAVVALAETKLLGQVRELTLAGDLSRTGVACLARRRKRLASIDVRGCAELGAADLEKLRTLADVVATAGAEPEEQAATPVVVGEWLVRHTRRPEWGIGKVVGESDDGLEVEFAAGGTKQIRNVELLEEVKQ